MRARRESGFSTLEVIAAVAIIAIALIPIATLQTQIARSQARLTEAHAESTAVQNAMALMRDINPMLTPEGQRRMSGATTLSWTSAPVSEARQSVNPAGFSVQLYRVTGTIRGAGATETTVQIDLIGWRASSDAPTE